MGVIDAAKKPLGYVNVIVPPGGKAVVGVNPSVIGTDDFCAIRSLVLMTNDKLVTCDAILPENTGEEAYVSADVCTVTLVAPSVAPPITKPERVTTNDDAGTDVPVALITTDVLVVGEHVAENPATLLPPGCTVGFEAAKNMFGKFKVIVPPGCSAVDSVKLNVTATPDFETIRSNEAI